MDINQSDNLVKLRKIVLEHWDPIGIADDIDEYQVEDEYDAYLPEILSLIMSDASDEDIFTTLWEIETSDIGLQGNINHTMQFAKKLKYYFLNKRL